MFTNITKRKILKFLKEQWSSVFWDLSEREFISMIYDVDKIPSYDSRYKSFNRDYHQHRVSNYDREDDRRLTDDRTWILHIQPETLVLLLETLVSPECRLDLVEIQTYKETINEIINPDWYMLKIDNQTSWHNIYKISKISDNPLHIPENSFEFDKGTNYFDKITYAKNLFRNHGSSEHEKKSAIKELADILESLRWEFKQLNLSDDEKDLFNIANNYAIRHSNSKQKQEYNQNIFYDFIFILYLNQIKLIEWLKWKI